MFRKGSSLLLGPLYSAGNNRTHVVALSARLLRHRQHVHTLARWRPHGVALRRGVGESVELQPLLFRQVQSVRGLSTDQKQDSEAKSSENVNGAAPEESGSSKSEAAEAETASKDESASAETVEQKSEIEIANEKLKELQIQVDEAKDHLLRALAETENVRARTLKEVESARTYGIQKFAKQVLEVADNLHRAIDSIPQEERTNDSPENHHLYALCQGVEMTSKELEKILQANGIEQYGEVGQPFDPHIHEAMFQMPDPSKEPNTIGQVVKTGYKFKDRVLRPAQVGTVVSPP